MTRVLLLLMLVAVAGTEVPRAQNPPTAGGEPRLLRIDAVAVDGKGNPVTDLKPQDVEVWIGGYRVPIETLAAVTPETQDRTGRLIVLLLDDLTLGPAMLPRAKEAARRFVTRMLPGDRMAVVLLNGDSVEISSDGPRLLRRVDAYQQSIGAVPVDQIGAHLLTTVASVARQIVEAPEHRKTIVAIGSAWLLDTPVPPPQIGRDVREEWFDALRALALADAAYYVIDSGGVGALRTSGAGFSREAGGHAFTNTNDLNGAVDQILREADHYYLIGVGDPPVGRKAKLRDLDVKVLRRGVTVRARRSIPGAR